MGMERGCTPDGAPLGAGWASPPLLHSAARPANPALSRVMILRPLSCRYMYLPFDDNTDGVPGFRYHLQWWARAHTVPPSSATVVCHRALAFGYGSAPAAEASFSACYEPQEAAVMP